MEFCKIEKIENKNKKTVIAYDEKGIPIVEITRDDSLKILKSIDYEQNLIREYILNENSIDLIIRDNKNIFECIKINNTTNLDDFQKTEKGYLNLRVLNNLFDKTTILELEKL